MRVALSAAFVFSLRLLIIMFRFPLHTAQAHDDLIRTYEARLVDLGIPESERNILVPRTNLTAAPAGLI